MENLKSQNPKFKQILNLKSKIINTKHWFLKFGFCLLTEELNFEICILKFEPPKEVPLC